MVNKIPIPQINYLVFELVKINVEDYLKAEYKAEQEEVIFFAVKPESFDYKLTSRDAIAQTYSNVFLTKYDFAPERCSIRGTFGDAPRLISGTFMDGWSRLKQFEDDIVRKSKIVKTTMDGDETRYLYALNYYDFWWQRFGSININSFNVNGNATRNSVLPFYSCDFIIIGNLIDVQSKDLLLRELKSIFAPGGVIDVALDGVNDILADASVYLQYATLPLDNLELMGALVQGSKGFLSGMSTINNQIYSKVENLF